MTTNLSMSGQTLTTARPKSPILILNDEIESQEINKSI